VLIAAGAVIVLIITFFVVSVISSTNFDKHFATAWAFYQNNESDKALPELNEACKTFAAFADSFIIRGNIYLNRGEFQLAIDDYSKALTFVPRSSPKWNKITPLQKDEYAYEGRGWAYAQIGEYNLALSDLTKALELNPNNSNAKSALEYVEEAIGQ
jgi:tetratricopeptide (TPR) repeat protein